MSARLSRFLLCCLWAVGMAAAAAAKPPPRSIEELRAAPPASAWTLLRALPDGPGFTAQLVRYQSAGLNVHALVATPKAPPPPGGFPVLVANHGFHPQPERYGITAAGVDSRPGDYYRPVPAAYAAAGFLVVMPDYRGHNISEGREFTRGMLASAYYTEDVLALLPGIAGLPLANARQLFMWGHSMGGEVTLRALLATDAVRGASLWSTVGGDIWEQAYYYAQYKDLLAEDADTRAKPSVDRLLGDLRELGGPYDWAAREPLRQIDRLRTPLMLQHAVGDAGADHRWSMRIAGELYRRGLPYRFHSYPGNEHFFTGEQFRLAVERDVQFFRSLLGEQPTRTPTR
jgi:uncharacterized protein